MPLPISFPEMPWIERNTRYFLSFSPMAAGLPQISKLRGKQFPNDHLDLFFNATVDAAIVMTTIAARGRSRRPRLLSRSASSAIMPR